MSSLLITFVLLAMVPVDPALQDRVDLVEVNHVYNKSGRPILDQVIFYQWSHVDARYQVIAWRLLRRPGQIPQRDWKRKVYVSRWFDEGILRNVTAEQYRETWTSYDPEMAERAIYPIEYRRQLATKASTDVRESSLR